MKFDVNKNAKPLSCLCAHCLQVSSLVLDHRHFPLIVNRGEAMLARFVLSDLKGCEWRTRRGYLALEDVNWDGTRMEIDPSGSLAYAGC